jgi:acylphosphatase
VKNKNDGRVEAVFEGKKADVQALITWCHTGPPHAKVNRVEVSWESCTGELSDFSVTY